MGNHDRRARVFTAESREPRVTAPRRFERLAPLLTGHGLDASYRETAKEIDTTEANIKVLVHRLRRRFGTLLRDEVALTLDNPSDDEVNSEFRYLFEMLKS